MHYYQRFVFEICSLSDSDYHYSSCIFAGRGYFDPVICWLLKLLRLNHHYKVGCCHFDLGGHIDIIMIIQVITPSVASAAQTAAHGMVKHETW